MPLYEYQCTECKQKIEILQKFSDPLLSECSKCGGELERVLSVPSIRFKGSGWYVTDYSGKNSSNGDRQHRSNTETKSDDSDKKGKSSLKTEQTSKSKASS